MAHCPTCGETRQTAEQIGALMPGLRVEIVELDKPDAQAPPEVFSVPTYMFNGDVISLGNPYLEHLEAAIRRREPSS